MTSRNEYLTTEAQRRNETTDLGFLCVLCERCVRLLHSITSTITITIDEYEYDYDYEHEQEQEGMGWSVQ
jgi:NADH dehydrogenase/NADH:ubiquinone oxidoreductase subunit G